MNDVYSDLFGGGGNPSRPESPFPEKPAAENPVQENPVPAPAAPGTGAAPVPEAGGEKNSLFPEEPSPAESFLAGADQVISSQNDALAHAREALEEARKLFGSISDTTRGTEEILNQTLGNMDEIKKEVMKDFLGEDAAGDAEENGASGETASGAPAVSGEAEAAEEPEEDPLEQLDSLIGLTTIKQDVRELTDFASVQKMRKDEGLKSVPVSLHLVFTGNPGTGKTTVARILGRLYKKIGILSKGQLVEVDRSGLVAGYVGQTAIKTQEKIAEARGGVLFIDEAYSLSQKDDAFGQESIDTILKAMEDYRDDFVVVVAGYTKPMEKFINSNPGLKSRFNKYIEFPDYTVDELEQIFYMNCGKYDYRVEEDAKKHIREIIVQAKIEKTENFANAREVRNLFEKIITNQAQRVRQMEDPSPEDMMTIRMEDLPVSIDDEPADVSGTGKAPEEERIAGGKTDGTAGPAGEEGEGPAPSEGEEKESSLTDEDNA